MDPNDQGCCIYPELEGKQKVVQVWPDMVAIVVQFGGDRGDRLVGISVLSASQYRDYLTLADSITLRLDDHWVMMIPAKQITSVQAFSAEGYVKKVRFVTDYRTTSWFGVECEGESQVFDLTGKPDGSYICGLETTADSGGLRSIGVVYWVPREWVILGLS